MTKNSSSFKDGNQAAKKHGIYSFQERGPSSVKPQNVSRLAELRQMVQDNPGRQELRQELTARMCLICDLGFAHLAAEQKAGKDIWAGGIIKRLGSYVAESRRLLDSFNDDIPRGNAADIITQALNDDRT